MVMKLTSEDLLSAHEDIMKLWIRKGFNLNEEGWEDNPKEKKLMSSWLSDSEVINILGAVVRMKSSVSHGSESVLDYWEDIHYYGTVLWECWEESVWNGRKFDERGGVRLESVLENMD